jgi:hypothetical protein
MPWPGFVWGVALDAVLVRGTSTCPSAIDVAAKLAPLVRVSSGAADVAEIVREGTTVSVSLARSDGRLIGRQTLEGTRCDDLADAAAVIVASWENDDARREGLSLADAPAPPPAAISRGRIWDVALGVGAALAEGSFSPALTANGSVAPQGGPFGLRLGGALAGHGAVDLPHGRVSWTRFAVGGGPKVAWTHAGIVAEGHLGSYFGWVRSAGDGFADNRNDNGFELSFVGSARVAGAGSGLRPWVEAAVAYWPLPVVAYELPGGGEGRLPALSLVVTAGVLIGR